MYLIDILCDIILLFLFCSLFCATLIWYMSQSFTAAPGPLVRPFLVDDMCVAHTGETWPTRIVPQTHPERPCRRCVLQQLLVVLNNSVGFTIFNTIYIIY